MWCFLDVIWQFSLLTLLGFLFFSSAQCNLEAFSWGSVRPCPDIDVIKYYQAHFFIVFFREITLSQILLICLSILFSPLWIVLLFLVGGGVGFGDVSCRDASLLTNRSQRGFRLAFGPSCPSCPRQCHGRQWGWCAWTSAWGGTSPRSSTCGRPLRRHCGCWNQRDGKESTNGLGWRGTKNNNRT